MGRSGMSSSKGSFDNVWESLAVNLSCPSPMCLARCRLWEKMWQKYKYCLEVTENETKGSLDDV